MAVEIIVAVVAVVVAVAIVIIIAIEISLLSYKTSSIVVVVAVVGVVRKIAKMDCESAGFQRTIQRAAKATVAQTCTDNRTEV